MPHFPQRNNQGNSSAAGQPPQQQWQPISGVSMDILEALMQIRMPQQRQMRPEARLNLLRYGDAFLFSLREVDLFNYFTGLVRYYRDGVASNINLFTGILENLANLNRQDLIQLVRPLMPQNWDTMFAEAPGACEDTRGDTMESLG
ncbi:hypothetical protein PRZ48_011881 [Zasmidium cellare]|uniref:Uncharacterized protein n=1 Tax=Zasmidium cellare TaxID=395010 RepID=A0ABR0E7T6_ZASCE|nr:hypothetical protein PRZ48_011881 [Zasmidium cellare]